MNAIEMKTAVLQVDSVSIRNREHSVSDEDDRYAVIRLDLWQTESDEDKEHKRSSKKRKATVICFDVNYFERVYPKEYYQFEGWVSFDYGATYLVAEVIKDEIGKNITKPESIFFDMVREGLREASA